MATRSNGASHEYLTEAELRQIRADLTMGDVWRVRQIEDETERGAALFFQAAIRMGLHKGDMESFLDRVKESDFAILTEKPKGDSDSPNE